MNQGKQTLYLWPFPKDYTEMWCLDGIHGSNHNHNVTRIEVDFPDHGAIIEYPTPAIIDKFVSILRLREARANKGKEENIALAVTDGSENFSKILKLRQQLDSSKLSDEDQKFLWKMRLISLV